MPFRVQRKRSHGWQCPRNTYYVGRPTKWGNPYFVGRSYVDETTGQLWNDIDAETALRFYREAIEQKLPLVRFTLEDIRRELRGHNLACWCKLGNPCHADILLELANA